MFMTIESFIRYAIYLALYACLWLAFFVGSGLIINIYQLQGLISPEGAFALYALFAIGCYRAAINKARANEKEIYKAKMLEQVDSQNVLKESEKLNKTMEDLQLELRSMHAKVDRLERSVLNLPHCNQCDL